MTAETLAFDKARRRLVTAALALKNTNGPTGAARMIRVWRAAKTELNLLFDAKFSDLRTTEQVEVVQRLFDEELKNPDFCPHGHFVPKAHQSKADPFSTCDECEFDELQAMAEELRW